MPRILPGETDIYAITDAGLSLGRPLEEVVSALMGAGVRILQYREKKLKSGAMLEECRLLRRLTREAGACFIVNDHVDIAMLVQADGVHVGQEDLPVPAVRSLVGPEMIIGLSTHLPEQAREARGLHRRGADLCHQHQGRRGRSRWVRVSGLGRPQWGFALCGHWRHQAA